jgi:DNA-binding response OmpR family regulator
MGDARARLRVVSGKVLVIEDDELYCGAIELALEGQFEVAIRNTAPGVADVAELRPSIVLLDQTLPGMLGSDYVRQLKGEQCTAAIPVIMMSGNHEILERDPVLASMCAGFLSKPFTIDELTKVVSSVIKIR